MSKFTQEDLLNAMGLKVGDLLRVWILKADFMVEDTLDGIILQHTERPEQQHYIEELVGVDFEIITLPKYTLTETEKHIVLAIDEKWKWIARDRDGLHIYTTLPKFDYDYEDFGCADGYTEYFNVFIDNFEYVIENQEPVSLDESREIAKEMK